MGPLSFVFFDTETTGLKHGFDQIVHFAAIRTDANLNEIERFEARSRLLPHVLPHPAALRTNGLPIGRLLYQPPKKLTREGFACGGLSDSMG